MYLKLVLALANFAGALSRAAKKGNGVMVAGRVILKLAPNSIAKLAQGKRIVLISGTNGKTTTTRLITAALSQKYAVATNSTGANLFAGIAAALGAKPNAEVAALEVDELVLPWAIENCQPELVVLLNLGRDQLDRLSEVRIVTNKWRAALKNQTLVLANADDPFVTFSAQSAVKPIWFSAGENSHLDAATCPDCGSLLDWGNTGYSCNCGFSKPKPDWILGENISAISSIPGKAAAQNATQALIVAKEFGVPEAVAKEAIASVTSVHGRFATKKISDVDFRLLLSKNPASWKETLSTSALGPKNVLLMVNANTQDGKDTSWLWDVDFTPLKGRNVLVSGDRRTDVSARLIVDGIEHQIVENEKVASGLFGHGDADLIASYTAFHRLVNK
ncbi:MAG: hypothetical protein RL301_624 [Actinomycetota bacterium]|jgi:UDP-N-acetylmuramyl tripeptide synthase